MIKFLDSLGQDTVNAFLKHTTTTSTYWHAEFYVGCLPGDWPSYTCYKYVQGYYFIDGVSPAQAKFKPQIVICGEGFASSDGPPAYQAHWRVDTDIPLSANGDKVGKCTGSSWTQVLVEESNFGIESGGNVWGTYDGTVGVNKYFPLDPINYATSGKATILQYHNGENDPTCDGLPGTGCGYYNEESQWVNGESTSNTNIVI